MRKKRNPLARELRTRKYRPRTVRPKKGPGSYRRRNKHIQSIRRSGF